MKRILISLMFLLPTTGVAGTTGTVVISGVVPLINAITVTPNLANNSSLNILAGESNKNVASVSEDCNNATGYKINIMSASGGFLVNNTNVAIKTGYKVHYDGGAATAVTASFTQFKNVTALTAETLHSSALNVDVTALPTAMAGTYSDTITLQIVANP